MLSPMGPLRESVNPWVVSETPNTHALEPSGA